jgi:hypothetical protein
MMKLGCRQRKLLASMAHYGKGGWPQRWHLYSVDREAMVALFAKGLITAPDQSARLTDTGHQLAAHLKTPPTRMEINA